MDDPASQAKSPRPARLEIATPVFEGPLDLLVALAERDDVDLLEVSLATLTDGYLAALAALGDRDPDEMAEFLWMAARLLLLKSIRLLPDHEPVEAEIDLLGWEEDMRTHIQAYRTYKDLAGRWLEEAGVDGHAASYPAAPRQVDLDGQEYPIEAALLLNAFQSVVSRIPPRPFTVLRRNWTLDEKLESLASGLRRGRLNLVDLLLESEDRLEAVVTFVALLELLRRGAVEVSQPQPFGPVWVTPK